MGKPEIDLQSCHHAVMVSTETISSTVIDKTWELKGMQGEGPIRFGAGTEKAPLRKYFLSQVHFIY